MVASEDEGGRYVSALSHASSFGRTGSGCNLFSTPGWHGIFYGRPNDISCVELSFNWPSATMRGFWTGSSPRVRAARASLHAGDCGEFRSCICKIIWGPQSLQDRCSQCMRLGDIFIQKLSEAMSLQSLRCLPRRIVSFHSINKPGLARAPTKKRTREVGPYPRGAASPLLKGYTNPVSREVG